MALAATVEPSPEIDRPDLLARLRFAPAERHLDTDLFGAIAHRLTDRRRFTSWPITDERIDVLTAEAAAWRAAAIAITDSSMRRRLELMMERARVVSARDGEHAAETAAWVDHGPHDGVPGATIPVVGTRPGEHPHRFMDGHLVDPGLDLIPSDGLVVIATAEDDPTSWLDAGEALSAIWLRATLEGVSVVPLSQVVEYGPTRELLRTELPVRSLEPQMVIRLGWQEIGRSGQPRTPRRPLDDVLLDRDPAVP